MQFNLIQDPALEAEKQAFKLLEEVQKAHLTFNVPDLIFASAMTQAEPADYTHELNQLRSLSIRFAGLKQVLAEIDKCIDKLGFSALVEAIQTLERLTEQHFINLNKADQAAQQERQQKSKALLELENTASFMESRLLELKKKKDSYENDHLKIVELRATRREIDELTADLAAKKQEIIGKRLEFAKLGEAANAK